MARLLAELGHSLHQLHNPTLQNRKETIVTFRMVPQRGTGIHAKPAIARGQLVAELVHIADNRAEVERELHRLLKRELYLCRLLAQDTTNADSGFANFEVKFGGAQDE